MLDWGSIIATGLASTMIFVVLGVLYAALASGPSSARLDCFAHCELRKVGREFTTEGQFVIIEECPEHGRTFCEAVPESVWMEFRDKGLPELRTSRGLVQ